MSNVVELKKSVKTRWVSKDSPRWLAFCALGWVRDHLEDYEQGECSAENIVEELPELKQLLEELDAAIKAEDEVAQLAARDRRDADRQLELDPLDPLWLPT